MALGTTAHSERSGRRSKRTRIYQELLRQIQSGQMVCGTKLPDIESLARHFSVAYGTMHAALSDMVRDGLLESHRGKGIFVAGRDRRRRAAITSMGLVLPRQEDLVAYGSTFESSAILQGCSDGASECEARLSIHSLPSEISEGEIPGILRDTATYDAMIFFGEQYAPLIRELMRRKFPVMMVNGDPAVGNTVTYDRVGGVRAAVRHLLKHGRRRMAYFGNRQQKLPAIYEELREHGIMEAIDVYPCQTHGEAYGFVMEFLKNAPRYDAVFVDNYLKARQLCEVLRHGGVQVPEDLAMMAFGTESLEYGEEVFLSYAAIPYRAMAREATVTLDLLARGRAVAPIHRELEAKLVLRHSCGCRMKKSTDPVSTNEPELVFKGFLNSTQPS